jgi:predicted DNA-binding protein
MKQATRHGTAMVVSVQMAQTLDKMAKRLGVTRNAAMVGVIAAGVAGQLQCAPVHRVIGPGQTITCRIPADLHTRLSEMAKMSGCDLSKLIRGFFNTALAQADRWCVTPQTATQPCVVLGGRP